MTKVSDQIIVERVEKHFDDLMEVCMTITKAKEFYAKWNEMLREIYTDLKGDDRNFYKIYCKYSN